MIANSVSAKVVEALLDDPDFDPKAFALDAPKTMDLWHIKQAHSEFFSAANNRHFGTGGWRMYKGNYVVGNFVRRHTGHFGNSSVERGFIVYKLVKNGDETDLRMVGSVHDRDQLKELIARDRAARVGQAPPAR
jgi:hypothetical protein